MKKPTQFFHDGASPELPKGSPRTNRAIYRLPGKDKNGDSVTIAVECIEGGGNVPRNATSLRKLVRKIDLEPELEAVTVLAEATLNCLKKLQPGEVEIEFGVELGGEMGIPLVTKGEGKANFKITLKWKAG